jgi:hypothetical protein
LFAFVFDAADGPSFKNPLKATPLVPMRLNQHLQLLHFLFGPPFTRMHLFLSLVALIARILGLARI